MSGNGSGTRSGRRQAGRTALAALVAAAGCSTTTAPAPPPPPPAPGPALGVETVASGLSQPTYLTTPGGDPRLFIAEQTGAIRIVSADGTLLTDPFLDLSSKLTTGGERGLLSLAFHPAYGANGLFYVNYTGAGGATVVERYSVSADPDRADPSSALEILRVAQPFSNHNGGQLQFGPDGMLYVFMGDGGGAGDPGGSGRDPGTLLGAVLRLDVDAGTPFAIPPDNPFVGTAGRDEIWAIGVRNPWRASFDAPTGTLFIADVGQSSREEVNAVPADLAGLDYGWNVMEGSTCFQAASCDTSGLTLPVTEYAHGDGCSITGGYVYRGAAIPEAAGHYFYSDFCSGFLRSFRLTGDEATDATAWDVPDLGSVTSFGVDAAGELYVLDGSGRVLRLVSAG